jgi:hypothetical protein
MTTTVSASSQAVARISAATAGALVPPPRLDEQLVDAEGVGVPAQQGAIAVSSEAVASGDPAPKHEQSNDPPWRRLRAMATAKAAKSSAAAPAAAASVTPPSASPPTSAAASPASSAPSARPARS